MLKADVETYEGKVYTRRHRLHGLLFALRRVGLTDHLNSNAKAFLPMVEIDVYDLGLEHPPTPGSLRASAPFMAVPKEEILWVEGGGAARQESFRSETRQLAILFGNILMRGDLQLMAGGRTLDHLNTAMVNKPFQTLQNVTLGTLDASGDDAVIERFEFVTVNLQNISGACELVDIVTPEAKDGVAG